MHLSPLRVALLVIIFVASHMVFADQKIKTKSNIKNDRLAESSSSAACFDLKEGSADGKSPCKTDEAHSSSRSVNTKNTQDAEKTTSH